MTIAVDFDGTIVRHEYPEIGKPLPFAFDVLKKLQQEENHTLILWTMREGALLQEAVDFCKKNGLQFYACNKNHPDEEYAEGASRKLSADMYIDDRNVGGMLDWGIIYKIIKSGKNSLDYLHSIEGGSLGYKKQKNWFIRIGETWDKARKERY